jgi:hypothetical protein
LFLFFGLNIWDFVEDIILNKETVEFNKICI